MAGISSLVETKELNTSHWKEVVGQKKVPTYVSFNEHVDTFTLLIVSPDTPKIVHYIDEHVALLYESGTMQVIGLRIESFKCSFLPKYANLKKAWKLSGAKVQLNDFGDLSIAVEQYERQKPVVAYEVSKIAHNIAEKSGLELPVPA